MSNDAKTEAEALAKLQEAATKGDWFREYGDVVTSDDDPRDVEDGCDEPRSLTIFRSAPHLHIRDKQGIANADLAVAAKMTALPRLTLEVVAENERLKMILRDIVDHASASPCTTAGNMIVNASLIQQVEEVLEEINQ